MDYKPQQKWQKENLKSISTKLTIADFERFSQYCKENELSQTAMIKKLVLDVINDKDE